MTRQWNIAPFKDFQDVANHLDWFHKVYVGDILNSSKGRNDKLKELLLCHHNEHLEEVVPHPRSVPHSHQNQNGR